MAISNKRLTALQERMREERALARETTRLLNECLAYYKLLRAREIVESESFAELLSLQKEQGKRLDALQAEYKQVLRELTTLRDDAERVRAQIGKASDRTERQAAKLDDFVRQLAVIVARMSGETLQPPKLTWGNRGSAAQRKKES